MNMINRAVLIDDEKFDHVSYKRLLRKSEMVDEIVSFEYAQDAIDYLSESKTTDRDVVFLDINMPRMNGFEFLDAAEKRFGSRFKASVIVMLTTSLNPSDREKADGYPAVKAFYNKPMTLRDIEDVCSMIG